MSKITIDPIRCKGCKFCISFCPKKCIEFTSDFNKSGYHPAVFVKAQDCSGCGICYQVCPDVCIEVYK